MEILNKIVEKFSFLVLGISSIVWGVLNFLLRTFFPTSVYDVVGNKMFNFSDSKFLAFQAELKFAGTVLDVILILLLIIIVGIVLWKFKIRGFGPLENNAIPLTALALITRILGLSGMSCIFMIAGGVFLILYKDRHTTLNVQENIEVFNNGQ